MASYVLALPAPMICASVGHGPERFINHDVAAEAAERRSMFTAVTTDGRILLIASPTDCG